MPYLFGTVGRQTFKVCTYVCMYVWNAFVFSNCHFNFKRKYIRWGWPDWANLCLIFITEEAQIIGLFFYTNVVQVMHKFWQKTVCATIWAFCFAKRIFRIDFQPLDPWRGFEPAVFSFFGGWKMFSTWGWRYFKFQKQVFKFLTQLLSFAKK
jgi:hypothetical protein